MKNFAAIFACFLSLICVSSAKAAELDSQAQSAMKTLKNTTFFAIGGVGYGNQKSDGEKALRTLVEHQDASSAFLLVLNDKKSSKTGQLYALLGLKWTNLSAFESQIASYLCDTTEVKEAGGCFRWDTRASVIAEQIRFQALNGIQLSKATEPTNSERFFIRAPRKNRGICLSKIENGVLKRPLKLQITRAELKIGGSEN